MLVNQPAILNIGGKCVNYQLDHIYWIDFFQAPSQHKYNGTYCVVKPGARILHFLSIKNPLRTYDHSPRICQLECQLDDHHHPLEEPVFHQFS